MNLIPETRDSVVVRTDFSDQSAWEALCVAIEEPVGEFRAYVAFLSDPAFDGLDAAEVLSRVPPDSHRTFLFVVDHFTLTHADRPILVLDLHVKPGRTFRVIPSEMWGVENNLSLANMDFEEFATAVDPDGVFRGFP